MRQSDSSLAALTQNDNMYLIEVSGLQERNPLPHHSCLEYFHENELFS